MYKNGLNTYVMVSGHYKYFNSVSVETVFRRQNLTFKDGPRAERVSVAGMTP